MPHRGGKAEAGVTGFGFFIAGGPATVC